MPLPVHSKSEVPTGHPWSPKSFNVCQNMSQINKIEFFEWFYMWSAQKTIVNISECLVPCTYKEYQVVGEPRKAKNNIYGKPAITG